MSQITEECLKFLSELSKNNTKEWFDANRKRYENVKLTLRKSFEAVNDLLKTQDDIEKMHVFRINRDVRFSKDKSPYKNHVGVHFIRRKPELRGGYYLHIEPGKSFLAGGFWAPEKDDMLRIRQEFELDDAPIRNILNDKKLKNVFGTIQGDALKTAPKNFDKEHPAIDLIKMKNWYFEHFYTDEEVLHTDFPKKVF
jgi:uncharacterized protein (TIGR02453 family)